MTILSLVSDIVEPKTYDQAVNGPHTREWKASMNKEVKELLENNTWEVCDRSNVPKGRKVTKSKWVYKIKTKKDGSIERHKSRFVACGYSQVFGQDYTKSFSATLRSSSFRTLIALSSGEKLKLEHFDVSNAFTSADIDSEIYIEPPKGYYQEKGSDGLPVVLKLKRALYGTKQASHLFQEALLKHLVERLGFKPSSADPCIFSKKDGKGGIIRIAVYVDDIIVAHNSPTLLDWFTKALTGPGGFKANHLGPLSWFLGIGVEQHDDFTVTLNQEQYLKKLIEKFVPNYKTSIQHASPCNPDTFKNLSLAQNNAERQRASNLPYLRLIGSLLYLSTMTRPDIAYHMSVLCSFMRDPSPDCYAAALDLLLYCYHTKQKSLYYSGKNDPLPGTQTKHHGLIRKNGGLLAYSDATWHRADEFGHNSFGYVIYLYGGPVAFTSKFLKVVALSSAEAEYAAASHTCREVQFLRHILSDFGFDVTGPTVIQVDNNAAIKICENRGVTPKSKHFDDATHKVRECYQRRIVIPSYVKTTDQLADGLTKPLSKTDHKSWAAKLIVDKVSFENKKLMYK